MPSTLAYDYYRKVVDFYFDSPFFISTTLSPFENVLVSVLGRILNFWMCCAHLPVPASLATSPAMVYILSLIRFLLCQWDRFVTTICSVTSYVIITLSHVLIVLAARLCSVLIVIAVALSCSSLAFVTALGWFSLVGAAQLGPCWCLGLFIIYFFGIIFVLCALWMMLVMQIEGWRLELGL